MSWGILYDVYSYKITALCYRDYELAVEILCEWGCTVFLMEFKFFQRVTWEILFEALKKRATKQRWFLMLLNPFDVWEVSKFETYAIIKGGSNNLQILLPISVWPRQIEELGLVIQWPVVWTTIHIDWDLGKGYSFCFNLVFPEKSSSQRVKKTLSKSRVVGVSSFVCTARTIKTAKRIMFKPSPVVAASQPSRLLLKPCPASLRKWRMGLW